MAPKYSFSDSEVERFRRHGVVRLSPRENGKLDRIVINGNYEVDFSELGGFEGYVWRAKFHPDGSDYVLATPEAVKRSGMKRGNVWGTQLGLRASGVEILNNGNGEEVRFDYFEKSLNDVGGLEEDGV